MCQTCKRQGIRPEYETILHPEYELLLAELEQETVLPRGLPAIEHYAVLKKQNASNVLVADGSSSVLTPQNMNPGYRDATGNSLVIASALQQALAGLLQTKYKKYIRSNKPSANDALSIALVDVTGNKLSKPELAGWGSTVARNAASTAKIAFLYAIHQLRFDLEVLLNKASITNMTDATKALGAFQRRFGLQAYNLSWAKIFDYDFSGGRAKLSFGSALAQTIVDTFKNNNNSEATKLLNYASYPYTGSLLWQSGLYHPTMGGLWVTSGYGGADSGWRNRPSVGALASQHNITALSAATYFTLMAQGRLVNDAASRQIKETLREACSFFWSGSATSRITTTKPPPTKCGIWSKFKNDVIFVEYNSGRYSYAACVLTDLAYDKTFSMSDLLLDLDGLIRSNNP